jgi:hypothetical protein
MAQFANVECLSTVYPVGEGWIGKSTTGQVRMFQSLSDYKQYLDNLSKSGRVCPDVSVPVAPRSYEKTTETPPTGFMEFLPRNTVQQSKYSAMSPYWLGQLETQKELDKGKYSAEEVYFYKSQDVKGGANVPSIGNDFKLNNRRFAST